MCTWVLIGVVVLLVLLAGAWRGRRVPGRGGTETLVATLGKRYLGEDWSETFAPANGEQIQRADLLIGYAERIFDRQIRKVLGILPFNAILLAVIGLEAGRMPDAVRLPSRLSRLMGGAVAGFGTCDIHLLYLVVVTMIGLAVSSLLCLSLLSIGRSPVRDAASVHQEVVACFKVASRRSRAIEWAIVLAQASLIVSIVLIAIAERNVNAKRPAPIIRASADIMVLV